ncbi:SCO family protein [Pelagibius marinus]|uniref:SCO family protein n=1 Tax=Pelagibius marinus TaxID=2762760 RepID=UPI0018722860|nr:SCO family protein [Pelagibius marinus]
MSTKTRVILIAVLGLVLAGGGFTLWRAVQPGGIVSQQGESTGKALIGGAFTLTDQSGARRSEADLMGRYSLIYFGYTYCPDVCPTSLSTMTQGLDILAESDAAKAAAVQPVFITIDPERDSVEVMAGYAEHFHPRLLALTGTVEEVAGAAKAYRIYYQKVEEQGSSDYLMDHSSILYLMGPDGSYLTHFTHASTAEDVAKGLAEQVDPALVAGS